MKKLPLLGILLLGQALFTAFGIKPQTDYEAIKYLNLSSKGIKDLPADISRMTNLEELVANNNQLYHLNAKLIYCKRLRRIELGSNGFHCVPTLLTQFPDLEHLGMEDNNLRQFPDDLRRLKKLKSLDLSNVHKSFSHSYNSFNEVPAAVCDLLHLEKLLLEKLPLRALPEEFAQLKKLKVLSLAGNTGMDWRATFKILAELPELEVLNLSFIGRSYLPPEIGLLKQVKLIVWKEDMLVNQWYINRLRALLPDAAILIGREGEYLPFFRGNSTSTLLRLASEQRKAQLGF